MGHHQRKIELLAEAQPCVTGSLVPRGGTGDTAAVLPVA